MLKNREDPNKYHFFCHYEIFSRDVVSKSEPNLFGCNFSVENSLNKHFKHFDLKNNNYKNI